MNSPKSNKLVRAVLLSAAVASPAYSQLAQAVEPGGTSDPNLALGQQESTSVQDQLQALDLTGTVASAADFKKLEDIAVANGTVRAIVTLQATFVPEGLLAPGDRAMQRAAIERARATVIRALAGTKHEVVREYKSVPAVALSLSPGALRVLQKSGLAARVQEDKLDRPILSSSSPVVESTETAAVARTGSGRRVAVLDTGVDKDHAFIGATQVSYEACFSLGSDGASGAGNCPNGLSFMEGLGAGEDCTYSNDCRHGTHVAGIVMGGPHASSPGAGAGVARSAGVIPVQVFSNFSGSALSWNSDQLAGLDYIFSLPDEVRDTVASVNMSIGGGLFAAACDTDARKLAIDNLLSVGIATVIASGNNGSGSSVSSPGCISTAVTVGAVNDADSVANFSNSSSLVDLFAIGVNVTSSVPDADPPPVGVNPPYAAFDGTSMATPMVAGAFAVLDQVNPTGSVATHLANLVASGKLVTDPKSNPVVTKPRIRVLTASVREKDTGFKSGGSFTGVGYDMVSNGVGLATRAGGPAAGLISLSGIPLGATIRAVYLYWATIGGPDNTAVFQGVNRAGTLVGASKDTNWGLLANRVYRATIPVATVPGNGLYAVSGVGGAAGVDGQGASLVVIYSTPSVRTGRVYLQHGAMTGNASGQVLSHTFTGLTIPNNPVSAHLNVGVGDGQAFNDAAMLFANNTAITPLNFFSGSDGLLWDDRTITLPLGLLPGGVGITTRANRLPITSDSLLWAFAGLAYQH